MYVYPGACLPCQFCLYDFKMCLGKEPLVFEGNGHLTAATRATKVQGV